MSKRSTLLTVLVLVCLGYGSVLAYQHYAQRQAQQRYLQLYGEALALLQADQAAAALELLESNFDASQLESELQAWPALMAQAALEGRNYSYLERMVNDYPQLLLENEAVVLWWARAQMHRGQWSMLGELLDHWSPEVQRLPKRWNLLRSDRLLLEGRVAEARSALLGWSGSGRDEANRQLRLALTAGADLEGIITALNAAYQALPNSADVRAMAAQLIEQAGNNILARREYVAAYLLEPQNPFYGDLLGEFYRRIYALPQAIDTWRETAQRTQDPRAWWKAWFWERVTVPRGEVLPAPSGEWWGSLASQLAQVPDAHFLSEAFLANHFSPPPLLVPSEDYHWFWLLERLKGGDEQGALEVLENMPQSRPALAPNLHSLLQALLDWRLRGDWPRGIVLESGSQVHRYLRFMEKYRPEHLPNQVEELTAMETFLLSDWSIPALFLAEGWLGAAQRLQPAACPPELIEGLPALDWIPYASVKMVAAGAGVAAAMERAQQYPDDLAVQGQLAELMIRAGQLEAGLARLEQLADVAGGAGFRAAYLSALAAYDLGDYLKTIRLVTQRPDLEQSVSGRELLARCALQQQQPERALEIYRSLDAASMEGLVYRYQVARAQSDRVLAQELLDTLLLMVPYELKFHQWQREFDAEAAE